MWRDQQLLHPVLRNHSGFIFHCCQCCSLVLPSQASDGQQDATDIFPTKAIQRLSFLNEGQYIAYKGLALKKKKDTFCKGTFFSTWELSEKDPCQKGYFQLG